MKKTNISTIKKKRLSALRRLYLQLDKQLQACDLFSESSKEERCAWIMLLLSAHQIKSKHQCSDELGQLSFALLKKVNESYKNSNPFFEYSEDDCCQKAIRSAEQLLPLMRKEHELIDETGFICAGYFYQWMCEQKRLEALKRVQTADKQSSKNDLIHFTQLYTPDWVADYLSKETTSLWLKDDTSRILSDIRILDPACGSGHILIKAFEYLFGQMLTQGKNPKESTERILNHNLRGCDIDSGALWTCALSLVAAAIAKNTNPSFADLSICVQLFDVTQETDGDQIETGSLSRKFSGEHPLSVGADIVIANPPYIGRRLMDRRLKSFLRQNYQSAHHDLSAAFLVRALELARPSGYVGFITQASLLFLPSYEKLRQNWLQNCNLLSVVELGPGAFPLQSGEKINSMLILLKAEDTNGTNPVDPEKHEIKFLDLRSSENKQEDLTKQFLVRRSEDFSLQRASALNYRCPKSLSRLFSQCKKLGEIAEIKQGLATSDNQRFLRYWWEVPEPELKVRWHPYVKGAGSERWSAPIETVVDWGSDGQAIKQAVGENYPYLDGKISWVVKNEQYYFREGLTFSFVNTGQFAIRKMPSGCIFDVGGSALFPKESSIEFLLAYLNSSFIAYCADLLNPTFNCQVGDIKQLPCLSFSAPQILKLEQLGSEAFQLKRTLDRFKETAFGFQPPQDVEQFIAMEDDLEIAFAEILKADENRIARLADIELEIDGLIMLSLAKNHELTDSAISEIKTRVESMKVVPKRLELERKFFAAMILRQLIKRALAESASGAFHISRFSNANEIHKAGLGLTPHLHAWLERALESSLIDWFSSQFNESQLSLFNSTPQIILKIESDKLKFVLPSSLKHSAGKAKGRAPLAAKAESK